MQRIELTPTRELADALIWAMNAADKAGEQAASKQARADMAGHALEFHMLLLPVLTALQREETLRGAL